ncbi:MAG: peptide chain release factor 1 [Candidatus Firestonebacteria bacterium]
MTVIEKLQKIEEKYNNLTNLLSDPNVLSDKTNYQKIVREISSYSTLVQKFSEYKKVLDDLRSAKELLNGDDSEMILLAKTEIENLELKKNNLVKEIEILMLPKDPNDDKNIIVEIRAGTGGEEASLFAADLFRMYSRYAESLKWKVEIISSNPTGLGGFKEIIFSIEGKGAYSKLKHESGVHRVQRIPVTESSGRIHTSTSTVAVLPEAEDIEVEIKPDDLKIDVFCSSGAGGQSVNTTYSAVRITHIPTGIVVSCQDERSQFKNKGKALKVLKAKLLNLSIMEQQKKISKERNMQIGSAERSEKIKTYNFPQNRVTDHRIGLSLYNLSNILDGELEPLLKQTITDKEEQ